MQNTLDAGVLIYLCGSGNFGVTHVPGLSPWCWGPGFTLIP